MLPRTTLVCWVRRKAVKDLVNSWRGTFWDGGSSEAEGGGGSRMALRKACSVGESQAQDFDENLKNGGLGLSLEVRALGSERSRGQTGRKGQGWVKGEALWGQGTREGRREIGHKITESGGVSGTFCSVNRDEGTSSVKKNKEGGEPLEGAGRDCGRSCRSCNPACRTFWRWRRKPRSRGKRNHPAGSPATVNGRRKDPEGGGTAGHRCPRMATGN